MKFKELKHTAYKGFSIDNALDFSKRSSFVREVMLERVYPTRVIIPMKQHYGDPAVPVVQVGESVTIGQCIGVPEPGTFAVPVHSSISGQVTDIKDITLPNGVSCKAVWISSDRKRTYHTSVYPRSNIGVSASEFMGIVKAAGIVGMGGEGIPTIAKINRARREGVKEILVNCLQSEPYAGGDFIRIQDTADYVIMGAVALAGAVGVKRIKFLISDARKAEVEALQLSMQRTAGEYSGYSFDFVFFKERFPQGYYRLIAKAMYHVNLEVGETIEEKCHAVIFNCSTVYACWEAVADNMPLISRIITVTDENNRSHNVWAPVGTPVSELLDTVNGISVTNNQIIWGNCLTGLPLADPDNTPIIKTTSGITVVRKTQVREFPCIHCGSCYEACPMELDPGYLFALLKKGSNYQAEDERALKCISCGACSYICPSGLNLTSVIASYASAKRNTNLYAYAATERIDYNSDTLMDAGTDSRVEPEKYYDNSMVLPFLGGKRV